MKQKPHRRAARRRMRNADWIAAHFEELVNQLGGTYVAVGRGRLLATGREAAEVLGLGSRKVPDGEISLFKVPRTDDLHCVLPLSRGHD